MQCFDFTKGTAMNDDKPGMFDSWSTLFAYAVIVLVSLAIFVGAIVWALS